MTITIRSALVRAEIETLGAQPVHLTKDGTEYLWQGDAAYWADRAPVLFPYIARMTEKRYTLGGDSYSMGIHGFAAETPFDVVERTESSVTLEMTDSAETLKHYPFRFTFRVSYTLEGGVLLIRYAVTNLSDTRMYFALGGHPGFNVPLGGGLEFSDYRIEFDRPCLPTRIGMSDDCFVTGEDKNTPLRDGTCLDLTHSLFDDDAIIYKNMAHTVTLKSDLDPRFVRVRFDQMGYLGLWHKPKTDAPYVCIEPWTSLPSRKGVVEDISCQSDMLSLAPDEAYENEWSIELG